MRETGIDIGDFQVSLFATVFLPSSMNSTNFELKQDT